MFMVMKYIKYLQKAWYFNTHNLFWFQISILPFIENGILPCVGSTSENLHRQCCITAIPLGTFMNCDAYLVRNTNK